MRVTEYFAAGELFTPADQTSEYTVARPDFCQLAMPHMGALYRTAVRMGSTPAEAEDLVQETYLEGFRCYGSLRDPERCRPWLFRILHNLCSERWARERARTGASRSDGAGGLPDDGSRDLERELGDSGYSEEMEAALKDLPEDFRTALLLVTVEEMSYAEVAEVMGCPIGTVRSRVARARALLATALATARAEQPAAAEPRKESL
jgi:RNA polymerase sigma-70 factor (ECF subfamily)